MRRRHLGPTPSCTHVLHMLLHCRLTVHGAKRMYKTPHSDVKCVLPCVVKIFMLRFCLCCLLVQAGSTIRTSPTVKFGTSTRDKDAKVQPWPWQRLTTSKHKPGASLSSSMCNTADCTWQPLQLDATCGGRRYSTRLACKLHFWAGLT
jgi:hypothetical protein